METVRDGMETELSLCSIAVRLLVLNKIVNTVDFLSSSS